VSARAVKVLKTTLVKAWMLAIFTMSLVMVRPLLRPQAARSLV
jgi:hypothetical protein